MSAQRRVRVMYPAALTPIGGAERQMLILAEHLSPDRFEVSFVTPLSLSEVEREAERLGAVVHAIGATRRAGASIAVHGIRQARRVAAYVALCRRERFDIVDAWLFSGYGLAAVTRPLTRVPVMIAGRRSLSVFKEDFGPAERVVDAIARRSADIIVANSQAVADDVVRREGVDPARVRVIRNGVMVPPAPGAGDRAAAREILGMPDGAPVVGCVGTFKAGKGQDRVVDAMAEVCRRTPEAWLAFVGDGPERGAIERRVAEAGLSRVRFLGRVPDARTLYGGFDALVSGSDAEGLPNVILEAAAAGVAIVATDAGGTREIVLDGETGILVPDGDTAGLARGLIRLLDDQALANQFGAAARAHVSRAFGVNRFVAETAALYETMDERRRLPTQGSR